MTDIETALRDLGYRVLAAPDGQSVTQRRLAEDALDKVRSDLAHVTRVMSLSTLTASIAVRCSPRTRPAAPTSISTTRRRKSSR